MTIPIPSSTESASGPASTPAPAQTSVPEAGFTIHIMSEDEDATLLLSTICTNKIPSYATIGSPEFEAMAVQTCGEDWREGRSAIGMESATQTIQGQLVLDRIREMPEEEARRQLVPWELKYEELMYSGEGGEALLDQDGGCPCYDGH